MLSTHTGFEDSGCEASKVNPAESKLLGSLHIRTHLFDAGIDLVQWSVRGDV